MDDRDGFPCPAAIPHDLPRRGSLLNMLSWYFRIDCMPDHSVLCRAMSSVGWTSLLEGFFSFVIGNLPKRDVIVATDATGYSGRKRGCRETPYALRPNEDWVKTHAAI